MLKKISTTEKKIIDNENGQALIELVVLFPLFIMMFGFLINVGNSINVAINQQKVTRAYFYAYAKSNSMFPLNDSFYPDSPLSQWTQFSMSFIGWRERFKSGTQLPRLACVRLKIPYLPIKETTCESYQQEKTEFIRIGTVYGLCGATYTRAGAPDQFFRGVVSSPADVASEAACTIRQ
ncbi:MAG: pilus assembly protein [Bacteriovoracaceae bacterium]|nr:pilus assembly protein [Bacteriovoracaceae bacterium]